MSRDVMRAVSSDANPDPIRDVPSIDAPILDLDAPITPDLDDVDEHIDEHDDPIGGRDSTPDSSPLRTYDGQRARRTMSGRRLARLLRTLAEGAVVGLAHVIAAIQLGPLGGDFALSGRSALVVVLTLATLVTLHAGTPRASLAIPIRAVSVQAIVRATGATAAAWLLVAGVLSFRVPAAPILLDLVLVLVGLGLVRTIHAKVRARLATRGRLLTTALVIGAGEDARTLEQVAADHPDMGLRIFGVLGDPVHHAAHGIKAPWLGKADSIQTLLAKISVDTVIVTAGDMPRADANRIVRELLQRGVQVLFHNGLRTLSKDRVRVQPFGYEPLLHIAPQRPRPIARIGKRAIDLVGASLLLIVAMPILITVSLLIKREDGGPILFRQTRVGLNGERFTLLKLRTMCVDAEERLAALKVQNRREGPLFKVENDPRITRVGRFLRASSVDEIPQLFNVLRGEMSLVGPRPALEAETAAFDQELLARISVTPGVTGLWQVEARDSDSFDAYRRLDLYYVENWSLSLDISILATTVRAVGGRALAWARGAEVME